MIDTPRSRNKVLFKINVLALMAKKKSKANPVTGRGGL
jgi:hypothetical protein